MQTCSCASVNREQCTKKMGEGLLLRLTSSSSFAGLEKGGPEILLAFIRPVLLLIQAFGEYREEKKCKEKVVLGSFPGCAPKNV